MKRYYTSKNWILDNTVDLKHHINILKQQGDPFSHPNFDVNDLIQYYEKVNDSEMVESLQNCKLASDMKFPSL